VVSFTARQSTIFFDNGVRLNVLSSGKVLVDWGEVGSEVDRDWLLHGWAKVLSSLYAGALPLHASCVEIGGKTVAVAGNSGAGKSTTAYALSRRGSNFLVDDVSVLSKRDKQQGRVSILLEPFERPVNLMRNSLGLLNLGEEEWRPMESFPEKGQVLVAAPSPRPRSIDLLVVIALDAHEEDVSMVELSGLEAVATLYPLATRSGASEAILGREKFMAFLTAIAEEVTVVKLRRNPSKNTLESVLDLIEYQCHRFD
jgi:hypothetical protein